MYRSRTQAGETFYLYAVKLLDEVLKLADGYKRVDMVLDVYRSDSVKASEHGIRCSQNVAAPSTRHDEILIPKSWTPFMSNIDNKN